MPQSSYRCRRLISYTAIAAPGLGLALLAALVYSSLAWGQEPPSEWTVSVGTPEFDEVLAVAALPSGVIVAGSTAGSLLIGQQAGGADAFTIKYDADGNVIWTQQFGTSGTDRATAVAAHSSGVYIAGSTSGTFAGETRSGGNSDVFLRKSNPGGFLVWTRQFGTPGTDQADGIAVDASGVYVVGSLEASAAGYSNPEGPDAFIRKYDFDGALLWEHRFGAGGADQARGVTAHQSGIYVAGITSGAFPGHTHHGGGSDIFIRKYDPDGAELWTRQLGTLGLDRVSGITAGAEGVYVVGSTSGAFPGQPQLGGGSDMFLLSYDFDGAERWVRQYGTEGADQATGVVVHGPRIYVVGSTSHAFHGYSNTGGNLDGFLLRFNPQGVRVWARQFGTTGIDRPLGIAAHADRLYIAGTIEGSFPVESDGFLTAVATAAPSQPEATPAGPAPTPMPEATPMPPETPAVETTPLPPATPMATPAGQADPTPTPAPTALPEPTLQPTATATAPAPRPAATPWPSPTPWPTFPPLNFPPPEDSDGDSSSRLILLVLLGALALVAIIGVMRRW